MTLDVLDRSSPERAIDLGAARAAARAAVRAGHIPCAVFGVADAAGSIAVESVNGDATSIGARSIFFLASVTKPIVATAAMQLVDEGRLELDVPLARYLPEFTGAGRDLISVAHVLSHTSGLPDLAIDRIRKETPTYAHGLRQALSLAPVTEPGATFAYASGPWFLVAEVIARLTGMSFDTALRRRLLDPLGMVETTFDARFDRGRVAPVEGVAIRNRLAREVMLRFMARATLPGGGLFSTLDDLLRFGRALLPRDDRTGDAPRVLSTDAITTMTSERTRGLVEETSDGSTAEPRYALGWRKPLPGLPGSPRAFTHAGISGPRIWVDPEAGLAFAFLTSRWDVSEGPAYEVLARIYDAWPRATSA